MKKLLFLLSIVLFVCACDPADTSSKKSSDRFPTSSPSVSQPGNVEWGDNSSSSNPFVSVSLPSSSNENNEPSSSDKVSSSVISSENKESSSIASSENKESSSAVNSENKESSSSSSSKEDKPSNILPGEGFGGLH